MTRSLCTCVLVLVHVLGGCAVPASEGPLDWAALVEHDAEPVEADDTASADASVDVDGGDDAPARDASDPPPALEASVRVDGGGAAASADASADPALDAFADAAAYVSMPVATSAKQRMAKTGLSPTKAACLGCHNGSTMTPAWLAGGTVFRDLNATRAAADVEVRIVDLSSARSYSAHTDADGNFYLPKPGETSGGPYLIGIRDGDVSRTMPLLQRGLDCNGSACHGGAQGPIHLP